ncbi:MAG: ABC transporter substrate-binding protein [Eubacteriales bacterium]
MNKNLKKLLMATILTLGLLSGCSTAEAPVGETPSGEAPDITTEETTPETQETEAVDLSVMAMSGPTAMGMVSMMMENSAGHLTNHNYDFSIVNGIEEVTAQLVSGGVEIAAVPANVASILYHNTEGGITVLGINTLGVLYIVENGNTITSIEDLAGKTIYASGKGGTPEYALNYILEANGLSDSVTVEWKSEQAEVVATITAEENALAMLPQPFATTAQKANESMTTVLDLTEEWNKTDSEGMLITGVVVARTAFVEENPHVIADFMENYEASVTFVQENVPDAAALIEFYEIVSAEVAEAALPYCSITLIQGAEMKTALTGYYEELLNQNPASIGGSMPEDGFFYEGD